MKKIFNFIGMAFLLFITGCQKTSDLAINNDLLDSDYLSNRSQWNYPPLASGNSRAFDNNNSSTIVGSVKNDDGKVVAFKLSKNDVWYSTDEVAPNGLPEVGFCINERGDMAGHTLITGGIYPAFWEDGILHSLPPLTGYSFGEIFDINASGQMVGESLNGNFVSPTAMRATLFSLNADPIDLGTLGGTRAAATGINDDGHICGVSTNASGQTRGFLYIDGIMQDIGTLGGTTTNANAINNSDQVVGRSLLASGAIRAFLYSNGVMTDLGTLGGASSVAHDINDRGDVVGFSRISTGEAHAFLYSNGVMTDLGALGGIESRAYSINNKGEVVGFYRLADGSFHGFIFKNGVMSSL